MQGIACTGCGAKNRTDRKFCGECGAPLPRLCSKCGFANDAGDRFCGGCGAALIVGAATPAQAGAADALEAERRPVTVLFADLTGYTRLSQALDAEDVHRLLEKFFAVVDGIVERFDGTVDKHIGDAVMAVFGAPVAHGDDPLRALRAGSEILLALPGAGAEFGHDLAAHIGIATGEVVASGLGSDRHRAYTVIGPSVNLAARLVEVAAAGEIVVDDGVHDAASANARFTPLEAIRLKGIDRPVTAWRFVGLNDDVRDFGERPFVGCARERAELAGVLDACAGGRGGSAVLVRGEPGIGKSRLIAELARAAQRAGFTCHTGLVLDFGMAKGRDAIREIVASLVGLPPGADADLRQQVLEDAPRRGLMTDERLPFLADLLDLPQPAHSRDLFEAMDNAARQRGRVDALLHLLQKAAGEAPRLVTIEDLHWADAITLDYITGVIRMLRRMRVVLALTTRIEGDPLEGLRRTVMDRTPLVRLDLGPLGEEEALALAGGLIQTSEHYARRCIERAGGNPLFLEQLLHAVDEHEHRLPASLHSLVLARMDRLPERERTALRAASVVGQRFPLTLLRELMNAPDYDCSTLVAHHLVRVDGDDVRFVHALIRDGVYASLTRPRRIALHAAAANWYGERDLGLRAEHLERAEAAEAPRAYLAAAEAQTAALHAERALALADRGSAVAREPCDLFALNRLRSQLLLDAGDGKAAVAAGEIAFNAASTPRERCRALLDIAAGHRLTADLDAALATLAKAERLAGDGDLSAEAVELHYLRGSIEFATGRIEACRAEHQVAYEGALALSDSAWEARAVSGLADADYAQGLMRTAHQRFARCVALCEANSLARIVIANRVMVGHCQIYLNEFDAGLAEMRSGIDAAVRIGNRHTEMFAVQSCGLSLVACGRVVDAEPYQVRARALAEDLNARRYLAIILAHQAEAWFRQGRLDEARANLDQALAWARETGMGFHGPIILGLLMRLAPDAKTRTQYAAEAEDLLAAGSVSHSQFFFRRYGIEDCIVHRDAKGALKHASALEAYTRREPLPYTDFLIRRARALAATIDSPADPEVLKTVRALEAKAVSMGWVLDWPS